MLKVKREAEVVTAAETVVWQDGVKALSCSRCAGKKNWALGCLLKQTRSCGPAPKRKRWMTHSIIIIIISSSSSSSIDENDAPPETRERNAVASCDLLTDHPRRRHLDQRTLMSSSTISQLPN